jgi:hypothetical protein
MITCMLAVIDVVAVSPVREMAPGSSWHRNTKEDKNRRLPDFDCHVRLRLGSAMSSDSREKASAWGDAHEGDDAYRHSGALNVKNVDWLEKVSDQK